MLSGIDSSWTTSRAQELRDHPCYAQRWIVGSNPTIIMVLSISVSGRYENATHDGKPTLFDNLWKLKSNMRVHVVVLRVFRLGSIQVESSTSAEVP